MMSNQKGSSRLDAALKMLLIAFISLLAFSSGVFFGKQMSDAKDHEMKALESEHGESTKSVESGKGDERPEDALNDEDVAELSEKLVKAEKRAVASEPTVAKAVPVAKAAAKHEAAHGAADAHAKPDAHAKADAHAKPDAHAKHEAAHGDAHEDAHAAPAKAATRVAMNETPSAPAKPKAEAPAAKALPKSVGEPGEGEYTVQIASYPEAAEAKARAGELAKKGYPAYPVEALVKGKTWYRVSIGSFRTMKEAGVYRAQLLKDSTLRSAIVQRIER